jgi:DNA-binding HxlR family transcriptional regulator
MERSVAYRNGLLPSVTETDIQSAMGRTADYTRERCAIAATMEIVGDPWTLLILRNAFRGVKRFEQFQEGLGVARNVLAARLKTLVAFGVMETRRYSERPPRHEYLLTDKGLALRDVLLTMLAWGERHVYGQAEGLANYRHKTCGCQLQPTLYCGACDEPTVSGDVDYVVAEQLPTVGEVLKRQDEAA